MTHKMRRAGREAVGRFSATAWVRTLLLSGCVLSPHCRCRKRVFSEWLHPVLGVRRTFARSPRAQLRRQYLEETSSIRIFWKDLLGIGKVPEAQRSSPPVHTSCTYLLPEGHFGTSHGLITHAGMLCTRNGSVRSAGRAQRNVPVSLGSPL